MSRYKWSLWLAAVDLSWSGYTRTRIAHGFMPVREETGGAWNLLISNLQKQQYNPPASLDQRSGTPSSKRPPSLLLSASLQLVSSRDGEKSEGLFA